MSTAPPVKARLMTAEEFGAWANSPENDNHWFELVRGEVIELPPPQKPHGIYCMNVARLLDAYVQRRGKGYVQINDSGVILERDPDTVRGPDVAVYEDEDTFDEIPEGYSVIPPVLAVEVLSPNDRADQITRKLTDYLQNGVLMVWLLDPKISAVTVYRPDSGPKLLQGDQKLTGGNVLPGFQCKVSEFFALPRRRQRPSRPAPKRRK